MRAMLRGDERREGAQDEDGGATIEAIVLATASGAGPQEIVARLTDALGCSCALVDAQGALCASAGPAPADAELDAVAAHAAGGGGALLAWRRFPVLAVRRVEGHLLVRRDGAAFGARERTILAAALPSLALALQARGGTTAAPAPAAAPADPVPPRPVADGLRASLLAAQPPETLRGLTGRLIDPVVAWDARRGTDLVGTLRAFLDADGRWDLTAAHLGVHVNTVRNRLGRIEELTGTDVALLADRVDFVLALEAQDLLGAR
jgi:hypothetical protein